MNRAGGLLLVLMAVAALVYHQGRWSFPEGESPPAFSVAGPGKVSISLGEGFPAPGVYHFSDGVTIGNVIKLTGLALARSEALSRVAQQPLRGGEHLSVYLSQSQVVEIKKNSLSAQELILLGIPLDPDRMTRADWESLPGIGPQLAMVIILDRQNNGDFGAIDGLLRVKGIGEKRLAAWRPYFSGKRGHE